MHRVRFRDATRVTGIADANLAAISKPPGWPAWAPARRPSADRVAGPGL